MSETGFRSLLKSSLNIVLAAVLVAGMAPPAQAFAAGSLLAGSISVAESVTNTYDAELVFSDGGVTASTAGSGYVIDGTALTINAAGTYRISGSCANGSIAVAKSLSDVTLVLDGLTLSASGTAPIAVKKSSNVTIHLVDGTTNTLTDSEDPDDENSSDVFEGAAIKVKSGSSVTFCGTGTLVVKGTAKNGIKGAATSTLTFNDGTYDVTATNNGIAADGDVVINGGTFKVMAGNDGIKSVPDSDDTDSNGKVTIAGGTFDIDAQGDGIQADAELNISAGTFDIKTLNGASSGSAFNSSTMSCKGLKASSASDDDADSSSADSTAGNLVEITGGTFKLDTADDAVHSDAYIEITGGTFDIATGDDGMHADTSLILGTENGYARDPDVSITKSYEGLEGGTVYVYSGRYNVVASDDGVNAAGGSSTGADPGQGDGNGFNGGGGGPGGSNPGAGQGGGQGSRGGFRPMGTTDEQAASTTDYNIYVYGGDLFVNCSGDGLDSNGGLYLYGGTQQVFSQSSSGADNSAIDADGTILIQGATVFTGGATGVDGTAQSSWFGSGQKYVTSTSTYSAGKVVNATVSGSVVYSRALPKASYYTMYSAPATTTPALATATSATACKAGSASHSWNAGTTADGVTTYTCTTCGATELQSVASATSAICAGHAKVNDGASDDSSDVVADEGYAVTFAGDSGVSAINVYHSKSYTAPDETLSPSGSSKTYDADSGTVSSASGCQVNFAVVLAEGYTLDASAGVDNTGISIEGKYNKLKDISDEAGVANAFRVTKATSDLAISITTTKLASSDDPTDSSGGEAVDEDSESETVGEVPDGASVDIAKPSVADAAVADIPDQTYTGKQITYSPVVTLDGKTLSPGIDYMLTYGPNVNVGVGSVTITGAGDYAGEKTVSFNIVAKPISSVVVSTIAKKYYTGSFIKPAPKVTDGATTLVKGVDYTLAYKKNKAVGTAAVIVTGKGNYTGTKTVSFKIVKRANTLAVSKTAKTLTARALASGKKTVSLVTAKKAKGTVTYTRIAKGSSSYLMVNKSTGKVTVKKGTPKGTYRVKIRVTASGNAYYNAKTKTITATVRVK